MIIEILISTIDSGIYNVRNIILPFREDVKYFVSHQFRDEEYQEIPNELIRDDVIISQIPGQGLTISRNNAIRQATGDVFVIADDDVTYTNEYFDTIKLAYEESDFDLICFKINTGEGSREYKNYPQSSMKINSLKDHIPSSIEITFKRYSILSNQLYFDERFGLGTRLSGGEESIFLFDALKKGLKVGFQPLYVVNHPYESTIKSFPKYHQLRVRVGGAIDARFNGWLSVPKAFAVTLKILPDLIRNSKNPLVYLFERLIAAVYILSTKPKH